MDNLVFSGQLEPELIEPVLRVLCKKHKHQIDVTLWEKLKNSALNPGELDQSTQWLISASLVVALEEAPSAVLCAL